MIDELHPANVRSLGLEFIELAAPDIEALERDLVKLGFVAIAKHRHKPVMLYRQGDINLIVNESPTGSAHDLALEYGVTVCALGLLVEDAMVAYSELLKRGAWAAETNAGVMELNIPAIEGIGGSKIFLIDRMPNRPTIYDVDFTPVAMTSSQGDSLGSVRRLSLKVVEGREQEWLDFFTQLLGFEAVADQPNLVQCPNSNLQVDLCPQLLPADQNVGSEHIGRITLAGHQLPDGVTADANGKLSLESHQPSSLGWYWESLS